MTNWTFDTRIHEIQTREIRDGNAMLFQRRTVIHNNNGTKERGEWKTTLTCPNYGDVYDKKPSPTNRVLSWLFGYCSTPTD